MPSDLLLSFDDKRAEIVAAHVRLNDNAALAVLAADLVQPFREAEAREFAQRDGEASHGLNMLNRVAADLAEYVAVLESDKLEVEVQSTTIFCVAANTASTAAVVLGHAAPRWLAERGFTARLVDQQHRVVRVRDWPREVAA